VAAARQRIAEPEGRQWQLEHRDPLTGNLLSLRAFRTQLELDFARADRYNRPPPGWSSGRRPPFQRPKGLERLRPAPGA